MDKAKEKGLEHLRRGTKLLTKALRPSPETQVPECILAGMVLSLLRAAWLYMPKSLGEELSRQTAMRVRNEAGFCQACDNRLEKSGDEYCSSCGKELDRQAKQFLGLNPK